MLWIEGLVIAQPGDAGVPGATVSVVGAGGGPATSADDGSYGIQVYSHVLSTIRAELPDHMAAQRVTYAMADELGNVPVELPLLPAELLERAAREAGVEPHDPGSGLVLVDFSELPPGAGASVDLERRHGGGLCIDGEGRSVPCDGSVGGNLDQVLFVNVPTGRVALELSAASGRCSLAHGSVNVNDFPVDAGVVTAIGVVCTP